MASILYITQIHIEPGALKRLAEECQKHRITRPLVVTDTGIKAAGLLQQALDALPGVVCSVFDATPSNPTEAAVRAATDLCHENKCDGLIAIGGGSSMDCAKGVGARVARPHKTIPQMRGLLRVGKKLPLLIAIPTTAGTGSECQSAALIADEAEPLVHAQRADCPCHQYCPSPAIRPS